MRIKKPKVQEDPIQSQPEKKDRPTFRKVIAWLVSAFLLLMIFIMVYAIVFPASKVLQVPGTVDTDTEAPVQNIFSTVTNAVVGYLRTLKLRSNLEYEFNRIKAENVQLVYDAMRVEELEVQLGALGNLVDEVTANAAMNPILCTVIGRDTGNYFSKFDIDKGSNDSIEDYMAVTMNGAMIGYTFNVTENSSKVLSIIDSQANIPGLIQTSRDQGMVQGALGKDGQAMCRMYYLPENLPRPGDLVVTSGVGTINDGTSSVRIAFPKGIPIGTVRESTRRMDANKPYIVIEPKANFQHIEYVIVLRYKPNAEAIEKREDLSAISGLVPLETPRPIPDLQIGDTIIHFGSPTPTLDPNATLTPAPTLTPTPTLVPALTIPPAGDNLEYQLPDSQIGETTPPPPTNPPTPSPTPTFSLDQLTVEED